MDPEGECDTHALFLHQLGEARERLTCYAHRSRIVVLFSSSRSHTTVVQKYADGADASTVIRKEI